MNANTAAPDPSAASIAQAFREFAYRFPVHEANMQIMDRAREIDASAPAAAVGGEWYCCDANCPQKNPADVRNCIRCGRPGLGLSTPAAPVGGFVVDAQPVAWRMRMTEDTRWIYAELPAPEFNDLIEAELLYNSPPAAQSSPKDGARVEGE